MNKRYYVLRRRGHFLSSAPYNDGIEWCKDMDHFCFQFVVTIISAAVKDSILIYHDDIIAAIHKPQGSCERMAETISERVIELLNTENVAWNVVHVRLFAHDLDNNAIPKANMEFVEMNSVVDDVKLLPLLSN